MFQRPEGYGFDADKLSTQMLKRKSTFDLCVLLHVFEMEAPVLCCKITPVLRNCETNVFSIDSPKTSDTQMTISADC